MALQHPGRTARGAAAGTARLMLLSVRNAQDRVRLSRTVVRVKDPDRSLSSQLDVALNSELVTPQFAAVLQEALSRNLDQADDLYEATASQEDREQTSAPSRAVMEVLDAALTTSGLTLRRLMALQSTIEAEIATEQKQHERLRFLLDKLQRDYAYFNTLEKMQRQGVGASNGASSGERSPARRRSASRTPYYEPEEDPREEEAKAEEEEEPVRGYASARELERSRRRTWRTRPVDEPAEPAHGSWGAPAEEPRSRRRASRKGPVDEPEYYERDAEVEVETARSQPPSPRRSWRTRLPSRVTESAAERRGFSSWEEGLDHGF